MTMMHRQDGNSNHHQQTQAPHRPRPTPPKAINDSATRKQQNAASAKDSAQTTYDSATKDGVVTDNDVTDANNAVTRAKSDLNRATTAVNTAQANADAAQSDVNTRQIAADAALARAQKR